jgi:hypothetical protein
MCSSNYFLILREGAPFLFFQCINCTWTRVGHLAPSPKFDGGYTATAKAARCKKDTARPRKKLLSQL